jgi:hypothetical protein
MVDEAQSGSESKPLDAQTQRYPAAAVDVWKKYEEIAMHFNDLMMRWRLQALGGLITVTTLAGAVVTQVEDITNRYWAMLLLSLLLLFGWIGTATIDLWYYRSLLRGAVNGLLAIEQEIPGVNLSAAIEEQAECAGRWAPYIFYVSAGVPVVAIVAYAFVKLLAAQAAASG